MKNFLRSSLVLVAFAMTLLARQAPPAAQDAPAPAEELPSAREIVDRFASVTRLAETLQRTSSMHARGKFAMEAMGLTGALEIWSAKPARRLVTIEMGGFGMMTTGFDGKTAWMKHSLTGPKLLAGTDFLQAMLEADFDGALKPAEDYESMRTLGRESFECKECYKVEFVARPLEGMDAEATRAARTSLEFYEVATGLLVGITGRQEGELGGGPFTSIQSDYRDFGGQLMATQNCVRQSGQEFALAIDTVEFDTAREDTFALPVEIQRLVEAAAAPRTPAPAVPK